MEQRLTMVTLGVDDLAAARAFYARLGWRESAMSQEGIAFFQAGGVVLGLFGRKALAEDAGLDDAPAQDFSGIALAHNVREKHQVAQVLDQAVQAGGRLVKPAQDVFWGGHSGYFADPQGHLWEVAWNPFLTLDDNGVPRLP